MSRIDLVGYQFVEVVLAVYNQYEEESSRACAMCNSRCGEGLTADITESAIADIALCSNCRADPAVVRFIRWVAKQTWLWLDEAALPGR